MDANFYTEKMCNILRDEFTYKQLEKTIDNKTRRLMEKLTEKYKASLTKMDIDYLTKCHFNSSHLYGLPKSHKSTFINNDIKKNPSEIIKSHNPKDLTFRPMVAGQTVLQAELSNFIDIILKTFLQKIKSYLRDDLDFLNKIPKKLAEYESSVTLNVSNICLKYWLQQHSYLLTGDLPNELIIDVLSIILEYNTFTFNSKDYIPIRGTAMGPKVAPTYVTLVMGYLENNLYETIEDRYGTTARNKCTKNWKRYLDDRFIMWDERIDKIEHFLQSLQNLHKNIKFTIEVSKNSINFLDIHLTVRDHKITTDIYCKPTDGQQYVCYKSGHPNHTKRNIPFNLGRRICTMVEDNTLRHKRLTDLKLNLIKQGYPKSLIQNCIARSTSIPIEKLRTGKTKQWQMNKMLPFVSTFNPMNPDLFSISTKTFSLLNASPKMQRALKNMKLIRSYRQPPSLTQVVTRAKFTYSENAQMTRPVAMNDTKVTKCNDKKCGTCPLIATTNEILFHNNTIPFKIKSNVDCNATNILYLINCSGCQKEYIGQTSHLRARVRIHKQQIRNQRLGTLHVSKHIAHCSIGKPIPFTSTPLLKFE